MPSSSSLSKQPLRSSPFSFPLMPNMSTVDARKFMLFKYPNLSYPKGCIANANAVMAPEDQIRRRPRCLADDAGSTRNWACAGQVMRRTYGFSLILEEDELSSARPATQSRYFTNIYSYAQQTDNSLLRYRYVEIPKTGSSFLKYHVDALVSECSLKNRQKARIISDRDWYGLKSKNDLQEELAFAFVRHPVKRFISAYGTVMNRLESSKNQQRLNSNFVFEDLKMKDLRHMKVLKNIWETEEPKRFDVFVEYYLEHGDGLLMYDFSGRCPLMAHVLSQTWFMNLYPGDILHIGKIEAPAFLHLFSEVIGFRSECISKHLANLTHLNRAEGVGRFVLPTEQYLQQNRVSIEKLNKLFAAELDLFDYPPV